MAIMALDCSIMTALVLPKRLEAWAAVDLLTITVTGHTCD
jgi:hypothetical protein